MDRLCRARGGGKAPWRSIMAWEQLHPAINAALNLTCFVLLVLGRMAIARDDVALHRRRMLGAFTASAVFLVSYVIRFATTGVHRYPGEGGTRRSTSLRCS